MTRHWALMGSLRGPSTSGLALAARSFGLAIVDGLGGRREAPRGRTGRCNIVRVLATYCGWRFEHDHPRGDRLLHLRLGDGFLVGCDGVFVPGLNRTDWRVFQVVQVEDNYVFIGISGDDDPILRQGEEFAVGRDDTTLASGVLVVVVGTQRRHQ